MIPLALSLIQIHFSSFTRKSNKNHDWKKENLAISKKVDDATKENEKQQEKDF